MQVELDEGVRLTANVVGEGANALHVGMPAEVVFDDVKRLPLDASTE